MAVPNDEGYRTLVTGSVDTNIKIWDLRKKACSATIKSHAKPIHALGISKTGEMIASGGADGMVKVGRVETERSLT